jgi:dTDP-4-amino-4,6-dideoxygalactose transaminase
MPVHYGGQACDLAAVRALAARHDLVVIEDAAHAAGIRYRGVPVGTGSPAVVFSFYATKNLTTGEGGMITTDDAQLADRMRRLALHGMSRDAWKRYAATGSWYYEVLEPGFKANMTDLQASIGLHQLARLPAFNARRAEIADRFDAAFASLPIALPVRHVDRDRNWHLYAIRLRLADLPCDRAGFIDALRERQIGTSVHYIPLHLHPFYRERFGYRPEDLPATTAFYEGLVSLPCYPRMHDDDVADVIDAVHAVCTGRA